MSEISAVPFCPRKGGTEGRASLAGCICTNAKRQWCSGTAGNAEPRVFETETKSHISLVQKSAVGKDAGSTGWASLLLILLSQALLWSALELHAWHPLWTRSQSDECSLNWLFILKYIILWPSREMELSTMWMTGRRPAHKPPLPTAACTNLKAETKAIN